MSSEKNVISICKESKKKCFLTYKDALWFARSVERANMKRQKTRGRERNRNVSKLIQKEMQYEKRLRSIYVCKYCGYYHFSSMKTKSKK